MCLLLATRVVGGGAVVGLRFVVFAASRQVAGEAANQKAGCFCSGPAWGLPYYSVWKVGGGWARSGRGFLSLSDSSFVFPFSAFKSSTSIPILAPAAFFLTTWPRDHVPHVTLALSFFRFSFFPCSQASPKTCSDFELRKYWFPILSKYYDPPLFRSKSRNGHKLTCRVLASFTPTVATLE